MNRRSTHQDTAGFTLIELMLAMSLFVFVMMVATVGFVGINRTFTKGVARKQLSESVQRLTEDITTTINNDGGVTSSANGSLCSLSACYVWAPYVSNGTAAAGLFKVTGGNPTSPDAKKVPIIDERYKIDGLKVVPIGGEGLYRVSGVIRSADDGSFNIPEGYTGDPAQDITCKGSAQANASTSCALEKFSFVIRAKAAGGSE